MSLFETQINLLILDDTQTSQLIGRCSRIPNPLPPIAIYLHLT